MSHDVNRWHAHPLDELRNGGDTIMMHSHRVECLCYEIAGVCGEPYRATLAHAARNHDAPEIIMGDWPYTLTRDYFIARWAKRILEWQIKRKMGLRWNLTTQEKLILALADKLDAYQFAAKRITPQQMDEYFSGDLAAMYRIAAWLGPEVGNWLHGRISSPPPKKSPPA